MFLPGTARIQIAMLAEVVIGRRPYTAESSGSLLLKVASQPLLQNGTTVDVSAALPPHVHAALLVEGTVATGGTHEVNFDLTSLPSSVFEDL